jgi:hypothetical protein
LAGTRILGALRPARWPPRRFFAVPIKPPLRHLVDDIAALAAQPVQAGHQLIHEGAQGGREMATVIPLEGAPLAFLRIEVGTVAGQWHHLQPRGPVSQRRPRPFAGVAGAIVEDEDDVAASRRMPGIEGRQVASEADGIGPRAEHFDPPAPAGFDAAKDRQPPIRAGRRQERLLTNPMPDPPQVGVGLQMGLVLIVQFVALGLRP